MRRDDDDTARAAARPRPRRTGCLTFIVLYALSLTVMYFLTLPPKETENFTGPVARRFHVAVFPISPEGAAQTGRVLSLEELSTDRSVHAGETPLLPEDEVRFGLGDIHVARVLENHGNWQLVALHYSNTHASTSTYRAYADRIEPVSYAMTSHVGQVFWGMALIIPAALLAAGISLAVRLLARRRRTRSS